MEPVGSTPIVREEQQSDGSLGDERSLCEHERVTDQAACSAPIPGDSESTGTNADREHCDPEHRVDGYHRAHPSFGEDVSMVEEGKPAPAFTLESDNGEWVSLDSLRGKPVVLYFYPRDDTPGCTAQARGIRDAWGEFEQRGAVVLGVSPDSASSHVKFKGKYGLPFTLLADEDHAVSEAYGVWVEKSMAGKTYMGVERSTFVIDADGKIAKVMRKVQPDTHAEEVLAALRD